MVFTTKGVLGEAWVLLKKNWVLIYSSFGAILLLNVVSSYLVEEVGRAGMLVSLMFGIASVILQLGLVRILLDIVDGKPARFSQILSEYRHTLTYIFATILYGLVVGFGLVLLIVPGIIVALTLSQYRYLIVDKQQGIMDSLGMSGKITRGVRTKLFIFWLVLFLVIVVSIIPFGLGLLITIPLVTLSGTIVYRRLLARHEGSLAVPVPNASQGAPTPPAPPVPLGEMLEINHLRPLVAHQRSKRSDLEKRYRYIERTSGACYSLGYNAGVAQLVRA